MGFNHQDRMNDLELLFKGLTITPLNNMWLHYQNGSVPSAYY